MITFEKNLANFLAFVARIIAGSTVYSKTGEINTEQRVYIANHSSHLDFIVLWAQLPKNVRPNTRPVAAEDYWKDGGIKEYLATKIFKAILLQRATTDKAVERPSDLGKDAVEKMNKALDEGTSLILFPEGTRGSGENLGEFKAGLYFLCKQRPNLEIMPVYMSNLNRILPKGELMPVPMLSKINFGESFRLKNRETKEKFLARARDAVLTLEAE
jgi:1-acyl-sn-glycerol-3-phosphate acyltransferase